MIPVRRNAPVIADLERTNLEEYHLPKEVNGLDWDQREGIRLLSTMVAQRTKISFRAPGHKWGEQGRGGVPKELSRRPHDEMHTRAENALRWVDRLKRGLGGKKQHGRAARLRRLGRGWWSKEEKHS